MEDTHQFTEMCKDISQRLNAILEKGCTTKSQMSRDSGISLNTLYSLLNFDPNRIARAFVRSKALRYLHEQDTSGL